MSMLAMYALNQCPNDTRCLSCDGTECQFCYQSYPDTSGKCTVPTTVVSNCYSYSENGTCSSCNNGYYLNNNTCTRIDIDDCAIVDPAAPTVCIACEDNTLVENGKCDGDNNCSDNCDICTTATNCVSCDKNHSLTSTNTCVSEPIDNCAVVGANSNNCLACRAGYYHTATACVSTSDQHTGTVIMGIMSILVILGFILF